MVSVGLLGATGYMGSPLCRALTDAFRRGDLNFVILHRASSDTSKYPKDVEKRVVNLDGGKLEDLRQALSGLEVVIAAVKGSAMTAQTKLIDALKGSPSLVSFVPSDWATPHIPEVLESPTMAYARNKTQVFDYAKKLGVPLTRIANGTTPEIIFEWPHFSSFDVKKNTVQKYVPEGKGKRGLTSKRFSGEAMVYLLLHRLQDMPNRAFSFVEIEYSVRDVEAALTAYHGKAPTIREYTEKDFQRDLKSGFGGAMAASRLKSMTTGIDWPGEMISTFPGGEQKSLGDYLRQSVDHPGADM